MQGVEIIDTIHSYTSLINPYWGVYLCFVGAFICLIGKGTVNYPNVQKILYLMVGIVAVGILVCICGSSIKTDKITDTKYKVSVSNKVSLTEFYQKYEVIEQNGQIFTVREIN